MYLLFLSLLVLLLVLLSCFFSGAETSITSVNTARLHELAKGGDRRAKILSNLQDHKEQVLGVILLGNTLANITASVLATALFLEFFQHEALGVTLSSIVMTLVILLFAEILPKTYAIYNPEKVSLFSAPIINKIWVILGPITQLIKFIVDLILRILSLHHDKETISAADAIRNLISLHNKDSTMSQQDIDMLKSVLDLAEMEISEIMTHRKDIVALDMKSSQEKIIDRVLKSGHINVPLWENNSDDIKGIINVYDLIIEMGRQQKSHLDVKLLDIIKKPVFVPDTTSLSIQLHNFRISKNNFAIVVDEYGSLQGIITLSDILEEIVGDIYHKDENDIVKLKNGKYRIHGRVSVRDINKKLRWQLPEDHASTIAGIMIHELERIPDIGEEFDLFGLHLKILQKEENHVTQIQASIAL